MFKFLKSLQKRDPALNKGIKAARQLFIIIILVAVLILPYFVFAAEAPTLKDNLEALGEAAGYEAADETTFAGIIGTVVSGFLGLLGIIFVVLMVYAGHNWMTAAGNEEKLKKAQETLWRAVIGLIIVVGSYAIWQFVWISGLFQ